MTDSEVATLVEHYLRDGNYLHRVRQGHKTIRWCRDNDPAYEHRAIFGSYNKTNPHIKRRWSSYENR
jgi:hypothetical protein